MNIPGSGRLMQYAGRQIGKRVIRELGLPNQVGTALGILGAEDDTSEGRSNVTQEGAAPVRRPLQTMDRATERAIGERAFQAAIAYLDPATISDKAIGSIAQAIAHATVEALDEYISRQYPPEEPEPLL